MEGREIMYNRQTPLHPDNSDPKRGWAILVVVGPLTGGALYIPCLNLRLRYTDGDMIMIRGRIQASTGVSVFPLPISLINRCGILVEYRLNQHIYSGGLNNTRIWVEHESEEQNVLHWHVIITSTKKNIYFARIKYMKYTTDKTMDNVRVFLETACD